jgi:putative sterol carrier protein
MRNLPAMSGIFKIAVALICAHGAAFADGDNATPADVFDGMRKSFRADKATGMNVVYQFQLSGRNGGDWWIQVSDGRCSIRQGTHREAHVTFRASDQDWVALANGTLGGVRAFLTGRLKISGDKSLARKLDEIFP